MHCITRPASRNAFENPFSVRSCLCFIGIWGAGEGGFHTWVHCVYITSTLHSSLKFMYSSFIITHTHKINNKPKEEPYWGWFMPTAYTWVYGWSLRLGQPLGACFSGKLNLPPSFPPSCHWRGGSLWTFPPSMLNVYWLVLCRRQCCCKFVGPAPLPCPGGSLLQLVIRSFLLYICLP